MFGMKGDKEDKNKTPDYLFEMEKDLKDPGKLKAMKEQLELRVNQCKGSLRQGEDKESFDQVQTLLHGYLAAQKVVQRVNRKM